MMIAKKWIVRIGLLISMCLTTIVGYAQAQYDGVGQIIQIDTRFRSFVGKPIWTLIIRDIDHDQNIPYLFDITKGGNHWVALTYGRNFLISASSMQIETYRSRYNKYKNYRMTNFCNLESNGKILRGQSMYITIEGDLSPYTNSFTCHVSTYPDDHLTLYNNPNSNS